MANATYAEVRDKLEGPAKGTSGDSTSDPAVTDAVLDTMHEFSLDFQIDTDVAATTDLAEIGRRVPHNCQVISAHYTSEAAITANDTNTLVLTVAKRDAADFTTADTIVAATVNVAFGNVVAFTPKDLGTLTSANTSLSAGDVLTFKKTHIGTGLALQRGYISVLCRRV